MKIALTLLSLTVSPAIASACKGATRQRTDTTQAAAYSNNTASAAFRTFLKPPHNLFRHLALRNQTGTLPARCHYSSTTNLFAHRCKQLGDALRSDADQKTIDKIKRQIAVLIDGKQAPFKTALNDANTVLAGTTLAAARDAFERLPDDDELTKMAYRFVWYQLNPAAELNMAYRFAWYQRNPGAENLDPAIDMQDMLEKFNEFNDFTINFTPLHGLENAHKLAQLLIDLVLCNPVQQRLKLINLPPESNIKITSSSLTYLNASSSPGLTTLDLSNCPALTVLNVCKNPRLSALDLSHNPALTVLRAYENPGLMALDVTNNARLRELRVGNNPELAALNLSNNPALQYLYASRNPRLTALDVSNNPALLDLNAFYNPLLINFKIGATQVSAEIIAKINDMVAENRARLGLPTADAAEHIE